ncbi:MAG: cell division protein FtsH [Anaerolineae bacterium]|nr:ATP-dependent zinc metalloprotease FtsH [Anaerolineales bacterium]MCQ3972356.1 cell division protein FtsH [Anaerolineae bacterium]
MNSDNHSKRKERKLPAHYRWIAVAVAIVGLVALLYYFLPKNQQSASPNQTSVAATLPQIVSAVTAGEVKILTVRGDTLTATKTDGSKITVRKESNISAVETLKLLGVPSEALKDLPIIVEEPTTNFNPTGILSVLAVVGLITFFIFRNSRQPQGQSGSGYNFGNMGRSNPRVISNTNDKDAKSKPALPQVTFRDVAGADQAKLELQEIIEFLKEPAKFAKLGARIPKGVLMAGPPGTGKTLLAKAVAGEAGVPFFSISGSEFVEMFVGVGAARVRDLFKRAREQAPAVVFVDEIDAVGRQRGASMGSGNDEREQTLNQILVEMDGFTTDTNVIVMASTNRPDILDPALLRPGRFDRKVILDRPDVTGREAILEVHTKGKPLAADISISDLAKLTPGFVGADLENLVNEAAILAARRNLNSIGRPEFQDAMERIIAGPERQGKILSDYERKVVAYHEAGHAVVMHNLENSDPVHKVSIISRGMALGYTMPLPEGDKYLRSREAFEDEIVGLLGGRAAEEIIFKRITTGAANDLERATKLARAMVTRFGFSQKLGLRTFGEEQGNPYLGSLGEIRNYSEEMAQAIDHEIRHILETAYQRAKDIVLEQERKLEALAGALLEYETVERSAFEALMA